MNYIALLAAGVASTVVGFLWYSPMVLGKPWMKAMGLTKEKMEGMKKGMAKTYAVSFVGGLVMAYVLSMLISLTGSTGMNEVLVLAFWAWFGFVAPVQLTEVLFGGKSYNLYFINTGYQLVSLLAMGAVLSVMG